MKTRSSSAREKLRNFFSANVGKVIRTEQLRDIAGISDYARRIRELRDEDGMCIKSHRERLDLRPGEYVLESLEYSPVSDARISAGVREAVLLRDGRVCRLCGPMGSPEQTLRNSSRKLRVAYMEPLESGGRDAADNAAVICEACYKSREKARRNGRSARELIALIRTAPAPVQREIYLALKASFERVPKTE